MGHGRGWSNRRQGWGSRLPRGRYGRFGRRRRSWLCGQRRDRRPRQPRRYHGPGLGWREGRLCDWLDGFRLGWLAGFGLGWLDRFCFGGLRGSRRSAANRDRCLAAATGDGAPPLADDPHDVIAHHERRRTRAAAYLHVSWAQSTPNDGVGLSAKRPPPGCAMLPSGWVCRPMLSALECAPERCLAG